MLTPVQTASLIVGYGLFVQAHGVWKLRHAVDYRRVTPLVAGGAIGVPLGIALLAYLEPAYVRFAVGVLLVIYSLYGMARPKLAPLRVSIPADAAIGVVNGLLGGLTGLAGPIVVIWCQLTGVPWAVQRAIFQPVILAVFAMTAVGLGVGGAITAELVKLFLLGLVPVLGGIWVGLHLYGRLEEAGFRRLILGDAAAFGSCAAGADVAVIITQQPQCEPEACSAASSFAMVRACGRSSMVERQLPKLHTRVRFPSPAPANPYVSSRRTSV